jgi:transposase
MIKQGEASVALRNFKPGYVSNGSLHRVRSRLVSERAAVINQIRGFLLERGIIVRQGLRFLRQLLPDILAKRADVLSPRMIRIVAELAGDWRQLDERTKTVTDEIEALAKSDDSCRRVMTVPGIGPIISSAMVAAIGTGDASTSARFGNARDASRSGAKRLSLIVPPILSGKPLPTMKRHDPGAVRSSPASG